MARISNGVITTLNLVTLLLALFVIGIATGKSESACLRTLRKPLMLFGVALAVVSLMGLLGTCFGISFLLWLYLFVLFVLMVGLFAISVFAIMVTSKWVGNAISNMEIGPFRSGDYTNWLRNQVTMAENWDGIKSCLADSKMCSDKVLPPGKGEDFYKNKLPPLLSGCCKPPAICGLQFQNATTWTMPNGGTSASDPDCKTWNNVQNQLCLNCESCKTAFLDGLKRDWTSWSIVNFFIIVFVNIVYSIGCCALTNNRKKGYQQFRGYP